MADWSASLYLKFEDERTRPARDLLAQIPLENPRRVVDIGCGPGNSTELLVARWPDADVSGIDTSPDMIEKARPRLPGIVFRLADAASWAPADRRRAVRQCRFPMAAGPSGRACAAARPAAPGGVLAVQMPDNLGEPSHGLMREAAEAMPFAAKLAGAARPPLPPVGPTTIFCRRMRRASISGTRCTTIRWPTPRRSSTG